METHPLYAPLLAEIEAFFEPQPDKPEETPSSILRALWFAAAGQPVSIAAINGHPLPRLGDEAVARLRELVAQKRAGAPLAHLTGRQSFLGLELLAGPAALIPRIETEILGRAAIAFLKRSNASLALDVCTGSGNLALAYAREVPGLRVFAADLSEDAVALARCNAAFTGLDDRVTFAAGDLFAPFEGAGLEGRCDLVSCNPPYITSAKVPKMAAEISAYEPRLAFDGGAMGLSVLTRLFKEAPHYLKPGGALAFELGRGQGPLLYKRLLRVDWVESVEPQLDDEGEIRALVAVRR
ncbi:MAG TPA: HemK/PrmC family methyltransferase [Burkholderiales bacterium]|nr:HemK/PrmC family methyltransferase [Burkholderiales bacterium]